MRPLSADEYASLETLVRRDGCREPLVVWRGVVIDGHNWLAQHGLPSLEGC